MRQKERPAHHVLADAKQKRADLDQRIEGLRHAAGLRDEARQKLRTVSGNVLAGLATPAAETQARAALMDAEGAAARAATDLPVAENERALLQEAMQRLQRGAWDSQRAEDYRTALPIVEKWIRNYETLREEADADRAAIVRLQQHYPDRIFVGESRPYPTDGGIPNPVMPEICNNPTFYGNGRAAILIEALRGWVAKTEDWLQAHDARMSVSAERE